jgi:hypothetical protein
MAGCLSSRTEVRTRKSSIYVHTYVHCTFMDNWQKVETTQMSTDVYTDEDNVVHDLSGQKEGNPPHVTT